MKIVADANIVDASALYEKHGALRLLPGRTISAEDVRAADALLVRSITKVDAKLVAGSTLKFVATATSGTDHLALDELAAQGIAVSDAAGSNANAVVEYCLASLAELILTQQLDMHGKRVAIIGFGHVGSRLYKALRVLGVPCLLCDPLVAAQHPELEFCSLDEALACPIISLHTPLSRTGRYATYHLLDAQRIAALRPGTLLINAGRGELVCNAALESRLREQADITVVLDCWENEPKIAQALLDLVAIGTPHIAGYSVEAKSSASARNYAAFCAHFGLPVQQDDGGVAPLRQVLVLAQTPDVDTWRLCAQVLRAALPVREIDAMLRAGEADDAATLFDKIRQQISRRREFSHYELDLSRWTARQRSPAVLAQLRALGFRIEAAA